MSRPRDKRPAQRAADDVAVPPEFVVGALAEVWADGPHDLGTAFVRHSRARMAWERAAGLDTALACAIAPARGPWSLDSPRAVERLARLGYSPDDVTWLLVAAQHRANETDPNRRTT